MYKRQIGDWKENQRDGIGVSYTPHGENIHVGRWSEDKPVGTGAIFDGDGNLSFAGKIENGMRQGVGISYKVEMCIRDRPIPFTIAL